MPHAPGRTLAQAVGFLPRRTPAGPGGAPADEGGRLGRPVLVEIMGNDQPGIVRSISTVLADHGLPVVRLHLTDRTAGIAALRTAADAL